MSVFDMATGKPIDGPLPARDFVAVLKEVIARVEAGDYEIEDFYIILDYGEKRRSFDSDLTISDAITMLEREKFAILMMAEHSYRAPARPPA